MLTKTRHNKKRNTAFIYEALVRELTKCVVNKDEKRRGIVVSLVKEHFAKGTALRKELDLYKAIYETEGMEQHMCEKLIYEVKRSHSSLDKEEIFEEQTALINKINKTLSKNVFANFVPNYKSYDYMESLGYKKFYTSNGDGGEGDIWHRWFAKTDLELNLDFLKEL